MGIIAVISLLGCATTGATIGSGVGERYLNHPPYYAGTSPGSPGGLIGHFPVVYQQGANQPAIFDPPASSAMRRLLEEMNGYLDSLGISRRLANDGRSSPAGGSPAVREVGAGHRPPDVQFHCYTDTGFHDDDCAVSGDTVLGRGTQTMRLAVTRASPDWVEWTGELMDGAGVARTLLITLEMGEYFVRQRGIAGKKEVELGTDYTVSLPWITSLETPVSVIQLTGALVGRDGKAIRIGAEGLLARRTSLDVSALGAQRLVTEEDVEALLGARREDLPGRPYVWAEGLRTLVARLTG